MRELIAAPRVAPSILSADFAKLGSQVAEVMDAGARVIHFDVMDGHFVPADHDRAAGRRRDRRPGPRRRRRDRRPPDDRGAGAPDRGVRQGRRRLDHLPRGGDPARQPHPRARSASSAAWPGSRSTPAPRSRRVAELRGLADIVLCMTVNPGWGGQSFIASSPDKVERLRPLVGDARIEVDGGIDTDDRRPDRRRRRLPLRRRLRRLRRRRPGRRLRGDRRRGRRHLSSAACRARSTRR